MPCRKQHLACKTLGATIVGRSLLGESYELLERKQGKEGKKFKKGQIQALLAGADSSRGRFDKQTRLHTTQV